MQAFIDHWLLWLGLGGGTVTAIVLALVAPSVLSAAGKIIEALAALVVPALKPVAAAAGDVAGEALRMAGTAAIAGARKLAAGVAGILDHGNQIAVVALIASGCWIGGSHYAKAGAKEQVEHAVAQNCKATIDKLHQCFWFRPKAGAPPLCGE